MTRLWDRLDRRVRRVLTVFVVVCVGCGALLLAAGLFGEIYVGWRNAFRR